MNLNELNNYIVLHEEARTIAGRIIADEKKDTSKFVYYLENIEFYLSRNQVSIYIVECGPRGHSEDQLIHVSFNKFCDPKYVLDIAEES